MKKRKKRLRKKLNKAMAEAGIALMAIDKRTSKGRRAFDRAKTRLNRMLTLLRRT